VKRNSDTEGGEIEHPSAVFCLRQRGHTAYWRTPTPERDQ